MYSKEQINIWELGSRINIKVNKEFINKINRNIKEKFKTKRNIHKELTKVYSIPFSTFKARIKKGYKYFIDLEIIVTLCNLLNISLNELQENVVSYKTRKGQNYIKNPKLPIKINPLFDMLIAHHIGDGSVINPERGRKPYFSYRQYNKKIRLLYLKKIERIFGDVVYPNKYFIKRTKIYFPTVISELFFTIYNKNVKSFLSKSARLPGEILLKNWKHQLAFILGTIIDDGHVDSTLIVISLKNKKLIEDLKKICDNLGYKSKITERYGDYKEYGCLYILKDGMKRLWRDYKILKKEYPEINLGYKEDKIRSNLNIINRKIKMIPGNQKIILQMISKENLIVNEIAKRILMTRQGVRYHINQLLKKNKIKNIGKIEENNVYSVV